MTLVLLALLSQTPPANCIGNACTVGQRGNDVTLGGQVKVTVGPLGDGGTAYIKPAIQGVPLVIQSEQPTGTSTAAAVTIQATNKHDGGTILSVRNGLTEVFAVGADGTTTGTPSGSFGFVDGGAFRGTSFQSVAASGADGFNCLTEGCRVRFGPDTYCTESGTGLTCAVATLQVTGNIATSTGQITSADNLNTSAAADLVLGRNVYMTSGGTARLTDLDTAVTVGTACTSPTVTYSNGSANFQFDVGTSCTGITALTVTFGTAAANGWACSCFNTGAATNVRQSGGSTTTAVITNYGTSVATPADWTDGADIRCFCRGG